MNYTQIINFIAYSVNSNESQLDELNHLYTVLKSHYSEIELSIYSQVLIEKLKSKITKSEEILQTALALGTLQMDFDFSLDNQRHVRDLNKVVQFWKLAIVYFEDIAKQPQQNDLVLKFDKLPDHLTPEQLKKLMGWTKSTIDTKHSRGELAGVTGTDLTPKQGLIEYLEKRTKGLIQKPEEWFDKEILKKPKKAKSIK
jgi:hypothetical protein